MAVLRGDLEWPARSPELLFMGSFKIPYLCEPSKGPTRFGDQHPGRNYQHNALLARLFTNARNQFTPGMVNVYVKQNFRHALSL